MATSAALSSDLPVCAPSPALLSRDGLAPTETAQFSSHVFDFGTERIQLFWRSENDDALRTTQRGTTITSTPSKPASKSLAGVARVNRPFKSPLAGTAPQTPSTVPGKRSLVQSIRAGDDRGSPSLPYKRRKSNLSPDPELLALEEKKWALVSQLKEMKDKLRQLQLLSKENNSPAVLEALTIKWKKATQEAALAYQAKCIESGAFTNQPSKQDRDGFFGAKEKASEKPGFMGWPGWTGWGWAKDDEDETEVDNAGRGKAGSRPSGGATNNATIDTSPTSLKSLIGRLGYNVQQLEQMLDYNDEDDSFKS